MIATPSAAASTGAVRSRDPLWDNLRLLAISLVVVGHTIESASRYDLAYALYLFVYAFHMPLFAFISGYFARAEPITGADGQRIISQLLAPYVIFSVLWALIRWWQEGKLTFDLTSPYWHLWFLPALAAWRLALPLMANLQLPVVVAVAVACISGYFAIGWLFDASRVLGMLPFFVAGWAMRSRPSLASVLPFLRRGWVRATSLGVLLVALVCCVLGVSFAREHHLREWVQVEKNYATIGVQGWAAGGTRLLLIGIALLLVVAIVSVTSASTTSVTGWGRATMYVYMLHLLPIYFLLQAGYLDDVKSPVVLLALVLGALLLTAVLSTSVVSATFRVLVEPSVGWLFRRSPERP
ncbi:MAG TPA: acyltransferase family protein [Propionibacteriaceae bacterium]|nr:acyltransferase family protein [Propionibacteriaceae bacterium]